LKIRSANLLDLGRLEQIYNEAGAHMSEAAPPARLWSLLSHTLSALMPLNQETLLYVAEEDGRLVGFVQASGQPLGINLLGAEVLQVLNLSVIQSADIYEVAPPLIDHLCQHALQRGVTRLVVRLPLDHPLTPIFRLQGFRQYATETVVYGESPESRSDDVPAGIRPLKGRDSRLLYHLYRKVTPNGVAHVEGATYRQWRSLRADLHGRLPGRGRADDSIQQVCDRGELVGWLRIQRSSIARPHTLSFLVLPEDRLAEELADHAINLLGDSPGAAWSSLRHYDSHMIDALRGRGFETLLTQALLVKELALKVPVREKGLVPAFG
jgi:hypothetical protein